MRIRVRRSACLPSGFQSCGALGWRRAGNTLEVVHPFEHRTISDARMVESLSRLVDTGVLTGQQQFESAAVAMIESSASTVARSWQAFYENSITELRSGAADFSPVHRRARSLIAGHSVLEVGCCFGFFALQCADDGHRVAACDISAGAVAHLRTAARHRGVDVDAVVGDALALPFETNSVDTVTLIHLLEHLPADGVAIALDEAVRVARQRVVVAVPFEEYPTEHFGHLQRLSTADLHRWSGQIGMPRAEVFTDHGGWLVLPADQMSPRLLAV